MGTLPPNPWGLHEVHGNVWEFCADYWNYGYQGAPTDGSEWRYGRCVERVLRGGSWNAYTHNVRSADRNLIDVRGRDLDIGFRLARTLTP